MKLICVGKLKETYLKEALEEYKKRLSRYTKLEIIELPDASFQEIEKNKEVEGEKILSHIKEKEFVITLEIDGIHFDSVSFSENLEKQELKGPITFVIGGSDGLSDAVKARSNQAISFSKLTFPHQLFRIIQIGRAHV